MVFLIIFLLSLVIRFFVLIDLAQVDPIPAGSDMLTYYAQALGIFNGSYSVSGPFYYHPLMPYLIALSFNLFGVSPLSGQILNCIVGSLSCGIFAVTAVRYFDRYQGYLVGLLIASYQGFVYQSTLLLDTAYTSLCLAVTLLFLSRLSYLRTGIGSLVLSIGILGRSNLIVVLFFSFLSFLTRKLYKHSLILILCSAIIVLPVLLWNLNFGVLGIVSSGPINLWIGNHLGASGFYSDPPVGFDITEAILEFKAFVLEHPFEWLILCLRKIALLLFLPDSAFIEQGQIQTYG